MTIEQKNTSIVEKKDYQLSKTDNRYNDSFIDKLNEAEKIADYIANSKTFSTQFETQIKDNEGMLIRTEVNKADIIACILLGKEIGLQPMAAIVLGKKLNAKSYFSVLKGKELGLDPVSAIQQISVIATQNGDTYHIGTHIINKVLLDNNVKVTILHDFEPIYKYKESVPKQGILYENFDDKLMLLYINGVTTADEIKKALSEGKKVVIRTITDRFTEINFKRESKNIDYTLKLTLQECTDSGWYKGYHSTEVDASGKPLFVEGKLNWNNMTRLMLRNRVISQGGRFVCDDKLNGIYSTEEVSDFTNVKVNVVDTIAEDVTDKITSSNTE